MRRREIIRVSSKGQIVLPKRSRERMDVREGDYVSVYELEGGLLLLEKLPQSPLDAITADLRVEAERRRFTREELAETIERARMEQRSDAE